MPEIEIRFRNESEYHQLRMIRDKYGVQWRGMLIQGAKRLEGGDRWFSDSRKADTVTGRSPESQSDPTHGHESGKREESPDSGRDDSLSRCAEDHNRATNLFDSCGTLQTLDTEANHEQPSVDEGNPVGVE
jgi:hypothetical protein